jgi:hypothetical protein
MRERKFENYHQFWLFYLGEHAKKGTKIVHTLGLLIGLGIGCYGFVSERWIFLPIAPVVAYAIVWSSHFWIEKNLPTTFQWLVWSFFSEFRLAWRTLTGRI